MAYFQAARLVWVHSLTVAKDPNLYRNKHCTTSKALYNKKHLFIYCSKRIGDLRNTIFNIQLEWHLKQTKIQKNKERQKKVYKWNKANYKLYKRNVVQQLRQIWLIPMYDIISSTNHRMCHSSSLLETPRPPHRQTRSPQKRCRV